MGFEVIDVKKAIKAHMKMHGLDSGTSRFWLERLQIGETSDRNEFGRQQYYFFASSPLK
jgi:hypothetical protein